MSEPNGKGTFPVGWNPVPLNNILLFGQGILTLWKAGVVGG